MQRFSVCSGFAPPTTCGARMRACARPRASDHRGRRAAGRPTYQSSATVCLAPLSILCGQNREALESLEQAETATRAATGRSAIVSDVDPSLAVLCFEVLWCAFRSALLDQRRAPGSRCRAELSRHGHATKSSPPCFFDTVRRPDRCWAILRALERERRAELAGLLRRKKGRADTLFAFHLSLCHARPMREPSCRQTSPPTAPRARWGSWIGRLGLSLVPCSCMQSSRSVVLMAGDLARGRGRPQQRRSSPLSNNPGSDYWLGRSTSC